MSFEGVEGSGKSTQIALLAERLRAEGRDVLVVREPGGTPLAEEARRLVLHEPGVRPGAAAELFLYLVARADLVSRVVRPALERGAMVLADRFDLSTRAYQIAGRGLPEGPVLAANALATGGLQPDLVIVLDLPAAVGRARQDAAGKVRDRLEREDDAFHRRVAEAFRAAQASNIVHLGADTPPEALHEAVWEALVRRRAPTFSSGAG
ncbi:MAG TPA: dTMP kinase [Gemmatimonadales bacterium]|nr:dTMP kinase [Gemmatimonadales bacterium]